MCPDSAAISPAARRASVARVILPGLTDQVLLKSSLWYLISVFPFLENVALLLPAQGLMDLETIFVIVYCLVW